MDKIKKNLFQRKSRINQVLDISSNLNKNIFNEGTIYKMFFEIEKLKLVLFNEDQNMAFEKIKIEYSSLFQKKRKIDLKSLYSKLIHKNDIISQNLAIILSRNKKIN